ncbi:RNA polymerase II mediator complex subunit [Ascosphaera pollenicola]|nr:RNA polymerase II mediator complex subunit [Ascosphaera pollenicola]
MAANILRRSFLYVPGSSERMLVKSRGLKADCVVYDLEDSVTPHKKPEARHLVKKELDSSPFPRGIKERAVRVNPVSSGYGETDLTYMLQSQNLSTVVVPKVESASDVSVITDIISHGAAKQDKAEAPTSIIALIESAKAVMNLKEICAASPKHLSGLVFGAADFAADLSITQTPDLSEFLYARSAIVTAARAYRIPSVIDLVCTDFKTPKTLEEECQNGKILGFNGKQCIHPLQTQIVDRMFSPETAEVTWAVRIIIANTKAEAQGRGSWALDGKMIDAPVISKARAIVAQARGCGLDVSAIEARFSDQEPE